MTYTFLLFDADNTLFDFHAGEKIAFQKALADFDFSETPEDYPLYSAINDSLWKSLEKGTITKDGIFATRFVRFLEETNRQGDGAALNTSYKAHLAEQAILLPHAEEVLQTLKARGFRLFLITNGDKTVQNSRLQKSGLGQYFEKVFISEEIGASKPDTRFFDAVANAIDGFEKDKALVIGDSESSDILGANRYRIDACHVTVNSPPLSPAVYAKYTVDNLLDIINLVSE
ncbi:MAG: YjjG family noncanonical pyrimidine nucleotidase [Clostridia bacterium]|nr:YjjG family noncanonical pyrimidine nucleotidase [Clostridia bacterium]